jgi:tocopherol cyclase
MKELSEPTGQIRGKGLPGIYNLKKIWNPSWFQGNRMQSDYFEGWYFKQVSGDGEHSRAFIPGISLAAGDAHSFVQAIDGKTGQTWYFRYPPEAFTFSRKRFMVRVGGNTFSASHMELDLADTDTRIQGSLGFSDQVPFRAGLIKPGIMGWYRYVPFMECYHGVVSMDHGVNGSLRINGREIVFAGGRGYIEKDWGSSMPEAWVWMQTNHFDRQGISFMLSIANIPWIGKSFNGFLGFLLYGDRRYDFATYTGARVLSLVNTAEEVRVSIRAKRFSLDITGNKNLAGALMAPHKGSMNRVIHESIDSEIHIRLRDQAGSTLFEGLGRNAGLELVGDTDSLKP